MKLSGMQVFERDGTPVPDDAPLVIGRSYFVEENGLRLSVRFSEPNHEAYTRHLRGVEAMALATAHAARAALEVAS